MADPLAVTINWREQARSRAKRYARFIRDATVGLLGVRKRRDKHHEVLVAAAKRRTRWDNSARELRAQLTPGKTNPPLESEIAQAEKRRDKAETQIESLATRIEEDNLQIRKVKRRAKRAVAKNRHFLKRARFFAVRVRHLRELKKQREKQQPEFKPWMANGADWKDASEGARAYVARAVVLHGLTCTSMARTYVPAGGSTTSYHLVWNGGRAGDAAGSMERMEACQRAEYKRGLGLAGQLEMFGPINDHCLKLGSSLTLAEGDPLENLHDTHVHCAEEDSAVAAALNRK